MGTINPLYIPLFTLEEVILDKDTGLPLSGGIVSFYEDSQRTTPKPVFQISGTSGNYTFVNVGSTFVLGINGTFVDGNGNDFVPYAYPYDAAGNVDLYFVTVASSGLVPQFTREAVPYLAETGTPGEDRQNTDNALSNPQFVEINFPDTETLTLDVTGTNTVTPIAPGWDIISSGTDTITIQRLQPTAINVPTNPPYALSITAGAALGASIILRQRLFNSPSFMRGDYASGMLTAAIISGGAANISMIYIPSTGTPTIIIPNTVITNDGAYHTISANALITPQINDPADTGYVDISLTIPTSRTIAITSIQVVPVSEPLNIPFDEQTAARQKDHLFHYYENAVVQQQKQNLLVGWTFSENPWQFITTTDTLVSNQTQYIADQTILHQETAGAFTSQKSSVANSKFSLVLTTVNGVNANRLALIQYIDYKSAQEYFGEVLSSLVRARLFKSDGQPILANLKMRLIYRTSGDAIPDIGNAEPITGWDANGDVTFANGWTAINPLNDAAYLLQNNFAVNGGINEYPAFPFDKFNLPAAPSAAAYLGIVIYTTANLGNVSGMLDQMSFDRVSLVNNQFAIDAAMETFDESLRRCQYYYEKSYSAGNVPGVSTDNKGLQLLNLPVITNGIDIACYPKALFIKYKQTKCKINPTMKFYAPDATADNMLGIVTDATGVNKSSVLVALSQYTLAYQSEDAATYFVNNTNTTIFGVTAGTEIDYEGYLQYHYTCDSRLGVN